MRGTDLTAFQIEHAADFIRARQSKGERPGMDRLVTLRFGDLASLVAWYGALRFQAGKTGLGGTFENPGPMEVR